MWRMDEGIRWQKAPRQFAGRGLAYWTDGNERARHRRHARLSHGVARREDRPARSEVRQERHRRSDGRPRISARAARRGRCRAARHQRRGAGAEGEAGRDVGREDEDRRRRHGRHRSRARPDRRQLARRSSSTTSSSSATRTSTATTRFACATFRATSAASTCAPASSCGSSTSCRSRASSAPTRGRTASKVGHAGRRQERRVGDVLGRSGARPRLHPGRHAADGRVRRPSPGRQPLRQQPRRARREDRASASGTSRWCTTTSGTTTRRWRRTCSTSRSTASRGRSSRRSTKQGWLYVFDRVTGEPIWPIVETPVLQSDVPGEQASPTQPIPSKPAPYAQQGLVEADLIDYTPAIKEAALKLAKALPHGSVLHSRVAGRRHGAERADLLVVRAGRQRRREHRRRRGGRSRDRHAVRRGAERPEHDAGRRRIRARSSATARRTTAAASSARCRRRRATRRATAAVAAGARPRANNIGGVSILKPKELGGITAYDMNTGDKAWWIPNGGQLLPVETKDPLFAGVTLPPAAPGRGPGAGHHDQDAGDLRHRARAAGRRTPSRRSTPWTRRRASRSARSRSRRARARCR